MNKTIIDGKFNSATVFTDQIEETAVEQIKTLCDQEVFNFEQLGGKENE